MPRMKTNEEYIQECKDKGLDLPIEDYKGALTKINHKCKNGHVYGQLPSSHLQGVGCPTCGWVASNNKRRKTNRDYLKECKDRGLDLPIEDYVNAMTKIKHKCNKGHIYLQKPNTHLRGIGCSICYGNKNKTSKEYKRECKDRGYDLPIEDYVNAKTKINHKCKYGHIYLQKPNDHLQGYGCPVCKKKSHEEYIKECKEKGLDLPAEDYIDAKTKIKHKCNKGHVYKQLPSAHLHGQGCSICRESHGEKFIRNYLDKNNIKYEAQKTFKNLKDRKQLSYDFYISDCNILIEYQGIQHYVADEYFGGRERFKKQHHHDNLKRKYAKDNGYKLLELHYTLDTQEKVNNYLDKYLN